MLHALTLAFALLDAPADERICGGTDDGSIRWCISMRAPNQCAQTSGDGWHCDTDGLCWCGPADALIWPGADRSGLPLVAREAAQHGVECVVAEHDGVVIGDCGYSGWVCRADWCQDTESRGWSLVPTPHRV